MYKDDLELKYLGFENGIRKIIATRATAEIVSDFPSPFLMNCKTSHIEESWEKAKGFTSPW